MKKNLLTLIFLIASFRVGYAASDSFNRADTVAQTTNSSPNLIGSHWTIGEGTWAITNNELKQAAGIAGPQTIYLNTLQTLNSESGTNFTLRATVQLNTAANTAFAGILFNFQNSSNYYAFRINGTNTLQLVKSVNGNVTAPFSVTGVGFTNVPNRPYILTVFSASPNNFSVGVYDTVTATTVYTNASVAVVGGTFTNGYGGFYTAAANGIQRFDDFSLEVTPAQPAPPTVLVNPSSGINTVGGGLTLTPVIDGYPAPEFQWKFNGVDIADATNQTLTVNNLQLTNAGSYELYATNSAGWASTPAAVITIPTGGGADGFNRANTVAQTTNSSPNLIGSHWTIGQGTWAITNNLLKQASGVVSPQSIYLNTLQTLNDGLGAKFTIQATVQYNGTASTSYAGLLFNWQNESNYYALRYNGVGNLQLIKSVNGAVNISGLNSTTTFTNNNLQVQNRPYRLTVASASPNKFSVELYDTVTGTIIYANTNVSATANLFTNGYGGLYASANVEVMRYDNFYLDVTPVQNVAPTVLLKPVGGNITVGSSLTLAAYIDGNPTPTQFQWQHNSVDILNATNQTLALSNLQPTNAGDYVLYATNSAGWVSTTAVLNNEPVASAITMGAFSEVAATRQIIGGNPAPTDVDGDPLAIVGLTQGLNGATVSTDGTNVTYTSATAFTGPDSFYYVVGDGRGGYATNIVTVNVIAAGPGYNLLSAPLLVGSGAVELTFAGVPSSAYVLEWATNLTAPIDWVSVITNQADAGGVVNFTNTSTAPANFFRTRQP